MNELYDGLFLMCMGMGTVFLFLLLLILATNVTYKLVGDQGGASAPTAPSPPKAAGPGEAELTAVITAAITKFRSRKR